jgi:hypothetical protein
MTFDSKIKEYRYVFKNQIDLEHVAIKIAFTGGKSSVKDFAATLQHDMYANRFYEENEGTSHRGSFVYDIFN